MIERPAGRAWLFTFILFCCAGAGIAAWDMRDWGDRLSPVDAFSEANALREVDGFRAQGIGHNAGLGNVLYGTQFPDEGFAAASADDRARSVGPNGVYTHYPPGPEYLLYLDEALFGPHPIVRLRLLPLVLCAAASVFFGLSIRRRFGPTVAWMVMLAVLGVAPLHDADTSLHFIGYAFALLLIEVAVAVGRNALYAPFFALGFCQGWLSFDYVFLTVLVPMAVELSLPAIDPNHVARVRIVLGRCCLAAAGFVLAHIMHFGEVWGFYGSFHGALDDLHNSARYRAGADAAGGILHYAITFCIICSFYVISPYPIGLPLLPPIPQFYVLHSFRFLGLTLGVWWPLVAVAFWGVERFRKRRGLPSHGSLVQWCKVGVIGIAISSAWWLAMQNHATVHIHLLYRHLSVCFILWALFVAARAAHFVESWPVGLARIWKANANGPKI
jgi:hypothetical protein